MTRLHIINGSIRFNNSAYKVGQCRPVVNVNCSASRIIGQNKVTTGIHEAEPDDQLNPHVCCTAKAHCELGLLSCVVYLDKL